MARSPHSLAPAYRLSLGLSVCESVCLTLCTSVCISALQVVVLTRYIHTCYDCVHRGKKRELHSGEKQL